MRIRLRGFSLYVVAVYIPPRSNPDLYAAHSSAIQQIVDTMSGTDIIMSLGDYNLPNLNWQLDEDINGYVPSNASSEQELTLVETVFASDLQQINNIVNVDGHLLDLVFVSLSDYFELVQSPVPLMDVDSYHQPFVVLLSANNDLPAVIEDVTADASFNFQRCDFAALNASLSHARWEIHMDSSVDEALMTFYDKLHEILGDCVPRSRHITRSVHNKPWWTPELRNLRNVLRKARFFSSKSTDDRSFLRDVENRYSSLLRSSYDSYVSSIQSRVKHDPSSFWSFERPIPAACMR